MATPLKYVLITPARNEAAFIELTLKSLVAQTVKPQKWVVVSDGSTDGTDELVLRYAADNPWIELVRMPERKERNFAGKVHAFNAGYLRLKDIDYQVIGSLDADISVDEGYFEFLLQKLAEDPSLGLVGTPFSEGGGSVYDYRFVSIEHVSGACQLFRRECFEAIGGYVPVKGGCIDHIAVITSRMNGWKTRTFTEKVSRHHRAIGTAQQGILRARWKNGAKDYSVGNHPLWELCRMARQMTQRPVLIGGAMVMAGYLWDTIRGAERPVSPELVAFYRREQIRRLKKFVGAGKKSGKETQPGVPEIKTHKAAAGDANSSVVVGETRGR
jgi:poly-beta-1,6-N-acetyl-D-glucosamine synthase